MSRGEPGKPGKPGVRGGGRGGDGGRGGSGEKQVWGPLVTYLVIVGVALAIIGLRSEGFRSEAVTKDAAARVSAATALAQARQLCHTAKETRSLIREILRDARRTERLAGDLGPVREGFYRRSIRFSKPPRCRNGPAIQRELEALSVPNASADNLTRPERERMPAGTGARKQSQGPTPRRPAGGRTEPRSHHGTPPAPSQGQAPTPNASPAENPAPLSKPPSGPTGPSSVTGLLGPVCKRAAVTSPVC